MTHKTQVGYHAGKGMHSQLYRNVLNAHSWMQNCVAFNTLYNDTGLVGVISSADSHYAGQSVDVLCKEMLVGYYHASKSVEMIKHPVQLLEWIVGKEILCWEEAECELCPMIGVGEFLSTAWNINW
jgi:hypothetical protein